MFSVEQVATGPYCGYVHPDASTCGFSVKIMENRIVKLLSGTHGVVDHDRSDRHSHMYTPIIGERKNPVEQSPVDIRRRCSGEVFCV